MRREDPTLTLQPFRKSHLPMLTEWLHEPHVRRWYGEPDEYLAWANNPPAGGAQAIIAAGASKVGYIRWQRVSRETLDAIGLREIPTGSMDVDIPLGEGPDRKPERGGRQ
jgi:aminoglycoside 6'-N-acetyltransferase